MTLNGKWKLAKFEQFEKPKQCEFARCEQIHGTCPSLLTNTVKNSKKHKKVFIFKYTCTVVQVCQKVYMYVHVMCMYVYTYMYCMYVCHVHSAQVLVVCEFMYVWLTVYVVRVRLFA